MALRLFKALRRQDPEDLSPQLRSNLDTMADKVRFREFRRTQGRPGITGPFGFVAGRTAPIPPQIAAGRVASRLGTDVGSELNRLTAPDPAAFARGARAPEFVGQELELGRTGITEAELANRGTEIDLGFRPEQLQQGLDVGDLGLRTGEAGLATAEAEEAQRARLRPTDVTVAEQEAERGRLGIEDLTRQAAGAPLPEEIRQSRRAATELLQTQAEQGLDEQRLAAMESDIQSLEVQGDFDGANRVRRQRDALLAGEDVGAGPPAPTGAPPVSRNINPAALQRRGEEAAAVGQATGLEGALGLLEEVANDRGAPNAGTAEKIESALASIEQSLALAVNEQTRDILKAEIRNSPGYISVKQRAGIGDVVRRSLPGLATSPLHGLRALIGDVRPGKLRSTQQMAQRIVELVEG